MTSSLPAVHPDQQQSVLSSTLERWLFYVLAAVALLYAFFAGLRTVEDFDLGWQMATARWMVAHHQVPKFDVLSYTMAGQPWNYPVGSELIFYRAWWLGGFALISWIGAAACVGTIAILLRRGTAASAAIAIIAVPLVAARTTPRADMFSVVLFAAYLSLLWENYRTGRARLWLLPVLMVAWANLHFGFASGLALVVAYAAAEIFEMLFGAERRNAAQRKLRRAWLPIAATFLATLINPWGWNIYHGLALEQRAYQQGKLWINEWAAIPMHWEPISRAILVRQTGGTIYLMLAIAVIGGAFALFRGQWIAAILLLGATYPATHAVRLGAVFACVVVIAGGEQWSPLLSSVGERIRSERARQAIAGALALGLMVLAAVRCFDLVTNRHYFSSDDEAVFGAGLCSWFPNVAAAFVRVHHLPPEIFNTYADGGYLSWSLGPDYPIYIDGRDTLYGPAHLARHTELLYGSPDSAAWQEEANRYNINTVVLALARYDGLPPTLLYSLCNSTAWRPVYLDEKSAVFLRNTPQNTALIQRFNVNCQTAALPASIDEHSGAAFNVWANSAITLAALERNGDAQDAFKKALAIDPDAAFLHRHYADLLFAMGRLDDSEREYQTAIALEPSADTWGALARSYMKRNRLTDAADAMEHEALFSPRPYLTWQDLGYLYLQLHQPEDALKALNKATASTPAALRAADNGFFEFKVAQGQAAAWEALGNVEKATQYQEQAANLEPNVPAPWRRLAKMYEMSGRTQDAERARAHAAEAEKQQH
jgi:tetratricopeptide (TPR) repeat protein